MFLAAGAIGALVVSIGYYVSTTKGTASDDGLAPALTEEEAVKIMSIMEDKFKHGFTQTSQYVQQVKMQYQQQGMMVDEKELQKALLPQAEKLFHEAEDAVCEVSCIDMKL